MPITFDPVLLALAILSGVIIGVLGWRGPRLRRVTPEEALQAAELERELAEQNRELDMATGGRTARLRR